MKSALRKVPAARAALRKLGAACGALLGFMFSAVLWIVILFIGGAAMTVNGAMVMFGPGPAFMVSGAFMLAACFLLKRAVTDGQ